MENAEALLEMDKELYVAAMKGNVKFLEGIQSDEYLLRKTQKKNNIIHLAIRSRRLEFIEAILRRFPNNRELICEENSQKNTPLHIAAEVGNVEIGRVICGHLEKMMMIEGDEKPWRLKNLEGNTPAHHALIHGNVDIAMCFLEKDCGLAGIVNDSKEAPLHLALKHFADDVENESIKSRIKHGKAPSTTNYGCGEYIKSRRIISNLVLKAGHVTCWHDINGLTPLHRAASLRIPDNVEITRFIIEQWPQSAEECDNFDKSILHLLINRTLNYVECKNLLNVEELFNLRNCQDHQGNTPLHVAVDKMDTNMARVLVEFETNLNTTNKEGISATSIIQQQNMIEILQETTMTKEDSEAADKADIEFLEERLKTLGTDFLRSRDSNGRNILHKLFKVYDIDSRYVIDKFISKVLSLDPTLVGQTDFNGDTPIHVLVQQEVTLFLVEEDALHTCARHIYLMKEEARNKGIPYDPPWIVQNADGNTPLLAALSNPTDTDDLGRVAEKLISYDPTAICRLANNHGENAFHLIRDRDYTLIKMIEAGAGQHGEGISDYDKNGLTPIMRALQGGWELVALLLLKNEYLRDDSYGPEKAEAQLRIAIQNKQFPFITIFLATYEDICYGRDDTIAAVPFYFNLGNQKDGTLADLLGEIDTIPPDLVTKLRRYPELRGIRSSWGIPKSQLQNYMSSTNVIAALLTTITFTAAFTIPGGLDQEKGFPLLEASVAFQVFMISDVIAMCLSMMVLFCLLWIVATNKRDAVLIQDFAVSLLLASFVATLLTFMMGVYAIIFPVKPWIAIATLVLCSVLMLLVHKFILTNLFLPLITATLHPIYAIKKCIIIIKKCIVIIKEFMENLVSDCSTCFLRCLSCLADKVGGYREPI